MKSKPSAPSKKEACAHGTLKIEIGTAKLDYRIQLNARSSMCVMCACIDLCVCEREKCVCVCACTRVYVYVYVYVCVCVSVRVYGYLRPAR